MRFSDKQKKVICTAIAVALIIPVIAAAVAIVAGV